MDFGGKAVVITGGGSGIGQACAREFADRHASVAVVDRDAKAGEQTVSELRSKNKLAEFFKADTSLRAQVEPLVPEIVTRLGGIDVLVNNAGIQRYGTVTSISEDQWDEVMNVNLKSAFLMSKYAIPVMIERGGGAIVMTGSVQSVAAQRNSSKLTAKGLAKKLFALAEYAQSKGWSAEDLLRSEIQRQERVLRKREQK